MAIQNTDEVLLYVRRTWDPGAAPPVPGGPPGNYKLEIRAEVFRKLPTGEIARYLLEQVDLVSTLSAARISAMVDIINNGIIPQVQTKLGV